jgi:hypothetical protein
MLQRTTLFALISCSLLATVARGEDKPEPMNKTFVNDKGQLEGKLVYTMVQVGGFVGGLGASVVIEPNGDWVGARFIARQPKTEHKGTLTPEEIKQLGTALAKHDFAGLPKQIGPAKAVPPRVIADGASTTTKLKIGEHQVVSNSADGVDSKEEEIALRTRLTEIGGVIRSLTVDAAPKE